MEIDAPGRELVVSFVRNGEVLDEFYCTDGTAVTMLGARPLSPAHRVAAWRRAQRGVAPAAEPDRARAGLK
jgi:hypothetical protein